MRKLLAIILAISLLGSIAQFGCGSPTSTREQDNNKWSAAEEKPTTEELAEEEQIIASNIPFNPNERFDIKLFQAVSSEDAEQNVFISPLSVSLALAMALNGAEGDTLDAMKQALELEGLTKQEINDYYHDLIETLVELDPEVILNIANSIWYKQGFTWKQEFLDVCSDYYDAEVEPITTADAVNNWVSDKTNELIPKIIDQVSPSDMMYLINAIYFKGTWTYSFEEEDTQDAPFYLGDGGQTQCRMMTQKESFNYYADDDVQIIDLPYGDGKYVMTVVLPAEDKNIDEFVAGLTRDKWETWIGDMSKQEVMYHMPKFKLEYEKTLNDVLRALGMEIAFGSGAAFSGMRDGGSLWIDAVKHKSFVEVNEEGTEAAAVTSVHIYASCISPMMRVDRPFVFMIREVESDNMVFMGKVVNPAE